MNLDPLLTRLNDMTTRVKAAKIKPIAVKKTTATKALKGK